MSMNCTTGQLHTMTSAARQTPDTSDLVMIKKESSGHKCQSALRRSRRTIRYPPPARTSIGNPAPTNAKGAPLPPPFLAAVASVAAVCANAGNVNITIIAAITTVCRYIAFSHTKVLEAAKLTNRL